MSTTTQRSKGWWKIWVLFAIIIAVIAIIAVAAYFNKIDLTGANNAFLGLFKFGGSASINGLIIATGWAVIGGLIVYAYYYQRGQKIKNTGAAAPWMPGGQTIPAQGAPDKETVVS